ncbi:MAG: plasmid pRiA4b ORF-3 family protein [Proteobacteria bacterium]|nr:plasmid pRiA4b ORF-3 family protein [Pseudomonadota bacterium]
MGRKKSEIEVVFKVRLMGRKSIWRMIALGGGQTLDHLHEAIFQAFDRDDPHLYSFYFPKARLRPRRGPEPKEYTSPYALENPDPFYTKGLLDASKARLDGLGLQEGQTFEYLFDFGDEWWHELSVEAINPVVPGVKYPEIRKRQGVSPPQYEYPEDEEEE